MKRIFAPLLCLSLVLVSCSSPSQTETPTPDNDPMNTPWADRSIYKSGLVESEQSVLEELNGASVYHIEFAIAENLYHVSGHEGIQYTNTESVALNEIEFRLFPNILGGKTEVTNLLAGGQAVTPKFELENSLLILPLPSPLEPGQNIVVSMDFKVTVPQSVDLNFGVLAYDGDVLALAHAYPMVAVYDDEGWNAEIPPQAGDLTYADASFYLIRITAPKDVVLVTTGKEIDRTSNSGTQTVTVASGPARDFYLAASPHYEMTSETFGETTIRSFAPDDLKEGAQQAMDAASRAIKVFSDRYGAYPYTEFDIVSTPTLALGIEYPGMTAITSRIYDLDQQIGGVPAANYLEATVAHETGHQWFYNLVGDDQLDDPWLDESLTQFATLQYFEDVDGPQGAAGFHQSLDARWARVNYEKIPIGLPVASYQGVQYGAIVYGRGPLFFEVLREEMGVASFDAFLKDYTEQLTWKIATPEFLQSLAEKHCGCDLDALFQDWVYPQ
jgi:peptidase M1-like protein